MSDNKQPEQPQSPAYQQVDPRMLAAMYGMQEEDEIDLLEYWRIIWKKRWLIIGIAFAAAVLAAGYSLTLPNIYRAEVVIAPVGEKGSQGISLGGLGGLASMAGISLGGSAGDVEVNLAVLKSREFLWAFVKENKLKPVLFEDAWDTESKSWREEEPTQWDAYRMLNGLLFVSSDKKSGLVTVAVEWTDAALAADWANDLVARLNIHLRQEALQRSKKTLGYLNDELGKVRVSEMRQALFELISQEQKKAMLASTQKEFAFRVLDIAMVPDRKAKPKRSQIVILSALVTGFLVVIFVFIREGLNRRDEESDELKVRGYQ
jgi:uncharacterized protein involved in exopolysaccharide biosynthesis